MREVHETEILSTSGKKIRYKTQSYGFDDGVELGLELLRILGPMFGDTLAAWSPKSKNLDTLVEAVEGQALGATVKSIADIPQRILAAGGAELFHRILCETHRLDKPAKGDGVWMKLDPGAVNDVYAGNYKEAFRAIKWVLRVNFDPLGDTLSWTKLTAILSEFLADSGAL